MESNTNNAVIKNSAEMAVKELSQLSPTNFKICGNHTMKAIVDGRKNVINKPKKLIDHVTQVD